ncbi:MAG: hypothetical protein JWR80_785 [Bradyrhizobium sp.]|nr:hypothetical protein [Bradyrhizobium sp.]
MVHCTDIAGSVGCGIGQGTPDLGRKRGDAPIGSLGVSGASPKIIISRSETCVRSRFGGRKRSGRFMTAISSVHAVDADARGPVKRHHQEHCKGRDGNAVGQT